MNVLLISVRSDFGGGPRHVHQLIEELPSSINIYMAFPQGKPYGNLWRSHPRIKKYIDIPYRRFNIEYLFLLRRFIIENEIIIVHSHGNGAGLYSRTLKLILPHVKVVHTFHGITNDYSSCLKYCVNKIIGRFFKCFTDKFILVSNGELKLGKSLHFLSIDKSVVIYNAVSDNGLKFSRKDQKFLVISLSRFDYQKNMDMAYRIAKALKNNHEIEFVWVGDGEDFLRLKQKSVEEGVNINFIGFTECPMAYLKNADLYLSTSRFEGLPYALIEAASVGLPIVATDVIGNNEVVHHNYNGLLFKAEQTAIDEIKTLSMNTDLLNKYSINSREFYLKSFTIEKMISSIGDMYTQVLNQ